MMGSKSGPIESTQTINNWHSLSNGKNVGSNLFLMPLMVWLCTTVWYMTYNATPTLSKIPRSAPAQGRSPLHPHPHPPVPTLERAPRLADLITQPRMVSDNREYLHQYPNKPTTTFTRAPTKSLIHLHKTYFRNIRHSDLPCEFVMLKLPYRHPTTHPPEHGCQHTDCGAIWQTIDAAIVSRTTTRWQLYGWQSPLQYQSAMNQGIYRYFLFPFKKSGMKIGKATYFLFSIDNLQTKIGAGGGTAWPEGQGGEMMMKSVFWWRKPEYPEETTNLRQVT